MGQPGTWISRARAVVCALIVCGSALVAGVSVASAGTISTFAGGGTSSGPATTLGQSPASVAVGPNGTLYIADAATSTVRAVSTTGQETTLAGNGTQGFSGDGGSATMAELSSPGGVAIDELGDLLIADNGNNRVRMIAATTCTSGCVYRLPATTAGDVYTIVGTGAAGVSPDGTVGTSAELNGPSALSFDRHGNLLIADASSVRVLAGGPCTSSCAYGLPAMTGSSVYTIAGTATAGYGGDMGAATAAQLQDPQGITVDAGGNVLIADSGNDRVRLLAETNCSSNCTAYSDPGNPTTTTPGDIYTISGGNAGSFSEGTNAAGANLTDPTGVSVDSSGNVLIADTGSQKVALIAAADCLSGPCPYGASSLLTNRIYTVAGTGNPGYSGDAIAATSAELNGPSGVLVDSDGNVLIADTVNNRVRLLAETTCLGNSCEYGLGSAGAGDIYTVAGNGSPGSSGDGGPAGAAGLSHAAGVAVDAATGDVVIADTSDNSVRLIAGASCSSACHFGLASTIRGDIYTIAGTGTPGSSGDGGSGTAAELASPRGVSVDATTGTIVIADTGNDTVRMVAATTCSPAGSCPYDRATTAGHIYTIAGIAGTPGSSGDTGLGTAADLGGPYGVVVDAHGDVLVADTGNDTVRMVAATACSPAGSCPYGLAATAGHIYTIAGTPNSAGSTGDGGLATAAELSDPTGVVVNAAGNVVIADSFNNRVRLVAATTCTTACPYGLPTTMGHIYRIAGNGTSGSSGDAGSATSAELHEPNGVAIDAAGDVLIADTFNNSVRLVPATTCSGSCPYGLPATTAGDIYTIAGNGTAGYAGDGQPATEAELATPDGVTLDADGDALIADTANSRIRVVSSTTTTLTAPISAVTNQTVTFTATVTVPTGAAAPAGTVSFNNNDIPIAGCSAQTLSNSPPYTATCQISFTASTSPETLNAIFTPSGSAPDGSASTFGDLTIGKDTTTTTLTVPTTGQLVGKTVTLTATVTPAHTGATAPSGTVTFDTGSGSQCMQTLKAGASSSTATCTVTYARSGTYTVTAKYSADANFSGSTSSGQTVKVAGASVTNTALPEISGTPMVGETLSATTGTWTGDPTDFSYVWEDCPADGSASGCSMVEHGGTDATYDPDASDAGHTMRVEVDADNGVHTGSATSKPTAIVAVVPLHVSTGTASTKGATVSLPALCSSRVGAFLNPNCVLLFLLTIFGGSASAPDVANAAVVPPTAFDAKKRRPIVVGSHKVKLRTGHRATVRITLNRTGQRLLAKNGKLKVKLTITEGGHTVSSRTITFKAKRPSHHKHR